MPKNTAIGETVKKAINCLDYTDFVRDLIGVILFLICAIRERWVFQRSHW